MRIALFGGTFNPVHCGHLLIADAALSRYRLDQVIFIPAGLPPHKKPPLTAARHRLAMLKMAIRGNPDFAVSDWEIRQARVVYTYESLEYFRRRFPKATLYFLVGADAMKNLPLWRNSHLLRRLATFVAAPRLPSFASRDIRKRVRKGDSIRYRVPERVEKYIHAHRLYRASE